MKRSDDPSAAKLSRGEVELLCTLHAVGANGCPASALAGRLGLSDSLAEAVAQGMDPLVASGLLARTGDRFDLTAAGRTVLATRLREVGVG